MKKVFAFLAVAALCVCACDPKEEGGLNGGDSNYKAPITIDGTFDDWATLGDKALTFNCAEGEHPKPDMKTLKIYADKYYVYVYVKMDYTAYEGEVDMVHIDMVIDGDASEATGGYNNGLWKAGKPAFDLLIEGSIIEGGEVCEAYEPFVGSFSGELNADTWTWEELAVSDFVTGKGTKTEWEFRIIRELYPVGKLKKEFKMGVFTSVNGWNATGALPNTAVTEENPTGIVDVPVIPRNE